MSYLCVIPARGGSKGLPGKNLRPLAGRPLIAWSIAHALATPEVARVVVSTDSEEIAAAARAAGAEVPFLRPAELARDDTPTEPVLLHVLEELARECPAPEAVVLLQPTSPLRRAGRLAEAIRQFEREKADSLVSACETHPFLWRRQGGAGEALYDYGNRPRRQDLAAEERLYVENGSIYITRTELLRRAQCRLGGRVALMTMDREESIDIDAEADLHVCEAYVRADPDAWA